MRGIALQIGNAGAQQLAAYDRIRRVAKPNTELLVSAFRMYPCVHSVGKAASLVLPVQPLKLFPLCRLRCLQFLVEYFN